jgi:hypothetical protein
MKNRIYQIEVVKKGSQSIYYTRGHQLPQDPKKRTISEIKDNTVEWEDGIHICYSIYDKEGKLICCIENVPTIKIYA